MAYSFKFVMCKTEQFFWNTLNMKLILRAMQENERGPFSEHSVVQLS